MHVCMVVCRVRVKMFFLTSDVWLQRELYVILDACNDIAILCKHDEYPRERFSPG